MGEIFSSEGEMIAFGKQLAKKLHKGDTLLLSGPLGAGKTTLVKGIIGALSDGQPEEVQSPTFAYVHPYKGLIPLFHFDLYRLEEEATFFDLDLDAYFKAGGIALVEWPERVQAWNFLEGRRIELQLAYHPEGRSVAVKGL